MAYGKAGDWYINNVEGGGGSSDFSTAEVTIQGGGTNPDALDIKFVGINTVLNILDLLNISREGVFTAVLYKNECKIFTNTDTFVSCEGSASYEIDDTDVTITITGDCTITAKFQGVA